MKVIKLLGSLVLFYVLALSFLGTAEAMKVPNELQPTPYPYPPIIYHYPYFFTDKSIDTVKPSDNIKSIRISKVSEVMKSFR